VPCSRISQGSSSNVPCIAATSSYIYLEVDGNIPKALNWTAPAPGSHVSPVAELTSTGLASGSSLLAWSLPYLNRLKQVGHPSLHGLHVTMMSLSDFSRRNNAQQR
jgi:hypothetical protein